MKILRIGFENLNSLAGAWNIDLSRSEYRDGLFLISGETGAGKTTILDAAALALFGRTARIDVSNSHNEVMTRGAKSCRAEVEFSCDEGLFTACWEQKRSRPGSQDPFQQPKRRLSKFSGGGWTEIAGTRKELEKETMRLVGAESFDQYLRTSMLAQGKFDTFLSADGKSDDKERSRILEQATGTAVYSRIGQAVHARAVSAKNEFDDLDRQLKGSCGMLMDDAERSRKEAELSENLKQEELLAKEVAALEAENAWHEEAGKIAQDKEALAAAEKSLADAKALFAPDGERLKRAAEALKLKAGFDNIESLAARARTAAKEAAERGAALVQTRGALEEALAMERDTSEALAGARSRFAESEAPIAEAIRLDGEIAKLEIRADGAKNECEAARNAIREAKDAIDGGAPFIEAQLARAEECRAALSAPSKNLTEAEEKMHTAEKAMRDGLSKKQAVDTEFENRRGDLEAAVMQAREDYLEAQRAMSHAEARTTLEDGKPCPLCGATVHPYCQGLVPRPDRLKKRLDEALERQTELASRREAAHEAFARADKSFRAAETSYRKIQDARRKEEMRLRAEIEACAARAEERRKIAAAAEERLPALEDAHKAAQERLKQIADAVSTALALRKQTGVCENPAEMRSLLQAALDTAAKAAAQAAAKSSAAKARLDAAAGESEKAAQSAKEAEDASAAAAAEFAKKIAERGYAGVEDWETACWSESEIKRAEIERESLKSREDGLAALRKRHEERVEEFRRRAPSTRDAITASGELAEKRLAASAAHDAAVAASRELAVDASRREEIRGLAGKLSALSETAAKWSALDKEIGGENGANFKLYAQGITLARLVETGNEYLAPMTNGRYEMVWDPDSGDAAKLLPLIIDKRAGGERRPVANLSGGERFQVSLALALGLAALNTGSLEVDTLFLDEGFGTLDEKALDIAIATLESVQRDGSKTIGIISHVRELESRIPAKITAAKRGNGESVLEGPGVTRGQAAPQSAAARRIKCAGSASSTPSSSRP